MNKFTNPAKRILKLAEQLASMPDEPPASQIWAEVFGLDVQRANSDPHEVNAQLNLVREELDLVERLMRETTFSENLYVPYIGQIRRIVSIANINASWSSYKPHLQPDTILALRYCSEILPSEPELSIKELRAILDSR